MYKRQIANCSSGIEPTFALAWEKQNILEGKTLRYTNEYFEKEARDRGFYSEELMNALAIGEWLQDREEVPDDIKKIYITAPEITATDHVLMQAFFQPHIDSGISKTINMPTEATVEDVYDTYMLAWREQCKGITVYRAGSREKEVLVKGTQDSPMNEPCCDSPYIVADSGCETCKNCGFSVCVIA